jgi:DNA-binding MarR family transcriptional regulator
MPDEQLETLLAAPTQVRSQYAKRVFEGLTPRALQTLIAVQLLGQPTVKDVADRVAVSQRSAGDLLRSLRSEGLVEATADTQDKRLQRQRITTDGRKVVRRFREAAERSTQSAASRRGRAAAVPAEQPRPDLQTRFSSLESLKSLPRAFEAEKLVAAILRRAHFRVDRNPGVAHPSQTDVLASDGKTDYVIEVKATAKPTDVGALKDLWSRLDAAPIGAVGVLVSLGGFTNTVPAQVGQHRSRPVLLLGLEELELLAEQPWAARRLLERKLDRLRRDGVVAGSEETRTLSLVGPETVAEEVWLVDEHRNRISWVESKGEFGMFSFTGSYEPAGLDSEPASGQQLDLPIAARSQAEMLNVLEELDGLGWLTSEGHWCIQQAETNWHGVGATGLRAALRGWKERYDGLESLHYREEVLYVDTCHLGSYSVAFDVAAHTAREVWYAVMSVHLPGIPVDVQPYLELARSVGRETDTCFRGRRGDTSNRWSATDRKLRKLKPIARVATRSVLDRERPYVRGVIVANPFSSTRASLPDSAPRQLTTSELLVCELGNWHQLAFGPSTYQITDIEWAWLGEGWAIRVRADWDDS